MIIKFLSWVLSFFRMYVVSLEDKYLLEEIRREAEARFYKNRLGCLFNEEELINDVEEQNRFLLSISDKINTVVNHAYTHRHNVLRTTTKVLNKLIHLALITHRSIKETVIRIQRRIEQRKALENSSLFVGYASRSRFDCWRYRRSFISSISIRPDKIYVSSKRSS
jgi:hypothetical protein